MKARARPASAARGQAPATPDSSEVDQLIHGDLQRLKEEFYRQVSSTAKVDSQFALDANAEQMKGLAAHAAWLQLLLVFEDAREFARQYDLLMKVFSGTSKTNVKIYEDQLEEARNKAREAREKMRQDA